MNPPDISPMHQCRIGGKQTCYCRPENNCGKGACGHQIAPVIDAEIQNAYIRGRGRV